MARFVIQHEDARVEVEVRSVGTFLNLYVEGYGQPVSLDIYGGKLNVLVNADKENEDDTQIISLEGAKADDWPSLDDISEGNEGRIIKKS